MTDLRPNFLVIGAARSGTTAVADRLRRHPEVFMTEPKEPHFLAFAGQQVSFRGPGDDATINRPAVTDPADYRALFDMPRARLRARGEASVSTLYHPDRSIDSILRHAAPDVRLVVILRDPVARAFSSYQYLRVRGFETAPTLADAVAREPDRIEAGYHHLWHYTRMSRYAEQLAPFLEAFGARLLVLDHAELERSPTAIFDRIAIHLDVDPTRMPTGDERVNASGQPRSQVAQRALQAVTRSRWRPVVKAVVPFALRERIRSTNLQPATPGDADVAAVLDRVGDDLARLPALLPGFRADWLPVG